MNLFLSLLLFISGWLLHIAIWRVYLPYRQMRALLFFFLTYPIIVIGLCTQFFLFKWSEVNPFIIIIFYLLASVCYAITYIGLEETSPTLAIIRIIQKRNVGGVGRRLLTAELSKERFIERRIESLIRDGYVSFKGENLQITAKGIRACKIVAIILKVFYRKNVG
jgi:hypothetical protein